MAETETTTMNTTYNHLRVKCRTRKQVPTYPLYRYLTNRYPRPGSPDPLPILLPRLPPACSFVRGPRSTEEGHVGTPGKEQDCPLNFPAHLIQYGTPARTHPSIPHHPLQRPAQRHAGRFFLPPSPPPPLSPSLPRLGPPQPLIPSLPFPPVHRPTPRYLFPHPRHITTLSPSPSSTPF